MLARIARQLIIFGVSYLAGHIAGWLHHKKSSSTPPVMPAVASGNQTPVPFPPKKS